MVWSGLAIIVFLLYLIPLFENMNKPVPISARLTEKQVHNDRFMQLGFELIDPFSLSFEAGQYVSLKVSNLGDRRSYSICSKPSLNHRFEFVVDISPDGIGSQYFVNLQIGENVSGLAPLGNFVISSYPEEKVVVFVATGSGIGPLRSMIHNLIQDKQDTRPIVLYWGMRQPHDFLWLNDFQDLVVSVSNFSFYPVVSRGAPEWTLSTGRVTDILKIHEFQPETGFYICGSAEMTQDTRALLLEKGVNDQYIHFEKYF